MRIGGLQKLTLIDYPGRVAASIFTVGCNYRCPFCHNRELVLPEWASSDDELSVADVLALLEERRDFLDAVVVSGGEPTLQPGLTDLLDQLKGMGFLVKLDTNGSRPEILQDLLKKRLVDYVAMDLKAPMSRYHEFAGVESDLTSVERAMDLVREAPKHEFRTTVAPGLLADDLVAIGGCLMRTDLFFLQRFRSPEGKGLIDPRWANRSALSEEELQSVWLRLSGRLAGGGVRA